MNIKQIAKELEENKYSPGQLAELLKRLVGHFGFSSEILKEIQDRKAEKWLEIRKEQKSDTMADRVWNATEDGKLENRIRIELKSLEKIMSGIKTILRVMSEETRNQY